MNDINLMKRLLNALPFAYVCHKYVDSDFTDEEMKYIYVEANDEFELLTSTKKEYFIGRSISEMQLKIFGELLDWVTLYQNISTEKENFEQIKFFPKIMQYYKIITYPIMEKYVVCLFENITKDMIEIENILHQDILPQQDMSFDIPKEMDLILNSTLDLMALLKLEKDRFVYIQNNLVHESFFGSVNFKTPYEVLGEARGSLICDKLYECYHTQKPLQFEIDYILHEEETIFLTCLTPILEKGNTKYIVASSKDITEFKKLQKNNEQQERLRREMFEKHTAVMLLLEPETGQILDANPAACEFYGYTKDEILKLCIQDINTLDAVSVKEYREKALKKTQIYFGFSHKRKDGEIRKVDVYSCPIENKNQKMLYSIIFDVTDREDFRTKLKNEKELLEITLKSIADGVVTTDMNGHILSINQSATSILKMPESQIIGKRFSDIFKLKNQENDVTKENPINWVLKTGMATGANQHTQLQIKEGKSISIANSAAPIKDASGLQYGAVMVFRDVSYEKIHQEEILFLSYHDALTGLYNRRYMEKVLAEADLEESLKSVIMIGDVNGLKLTNDVFGHEAGDKLLKLIADILLESCRPKDIVARWGGDEFLMYLPDTDIVSVEKIMLKIKTKCEMQSIDNMWVSVALGASCVFEFGNVITTLQSAEEKMYHQKFLDGKSYRNQIIQKHLATLDTKRLETKEHSKRLKMYCMRIGAQLNLSLEDQERLSLFSMIHDIGKIGISESVWNKKGKLTKEDWDEVKKHTEIGYRMAQCTPELEKVAEYILSHHERWDGMGYPRGLKGIEIPLQSRILAVVDAYDAMTHDRIYRKALDEDIAKQELIRNSGTQFDPDIVSAFMELLEKK